MVRTAARPVTHRRMVRRHKALNRRKRHVLRWALGIATLVLVAECVVAALFSPRFHIKAVAITGLQTMPEGRLRKQFQVPTGQNLFLAPTHDWEKAITRLPGVESVTIHKHLPGQLEVMVQERKPWASVRTSDGSWHTIDTQFVPFRTTAQPEPGLLRILASDFAPWEALPGIPLPSAGLEAARECARWAADYRKFPVSQIEIDRGSKVCLNRVGGVPVYLGSSEKINQKLTSLEKLLTVRPDLITKDNTQLRYINLFAADAPAIAEKPALPEPKP